jgi:hypothetical protein
VRGPAGKSGPRRGGARQNRRRRVGEEVTAARGGVAAAGLARAGRVKRNRRRGGAGPAPGPGSGRGTPPLRTSALRTADGLPQEHREVLGYAGRGKRA